MDLNQIKRDVDALVAQAQTELDKLTDDEKMQLAGGYDNRGLDCISERWYGPESLRNDSALATMGEIILKIGDVMRTFHSTVEFDEG